MTEVYVVTMGDYNDTRVAQVFTDQGAAEAFVAAYNAAQGWEGAWVDAYPAHDADWVPGEFLRIITKLALVGGDVISVEEMRECDWDSGDEGSVKTEVRLRCGHFEVWTLGDARKVPQVHADAVAKKRAEITGL